MAIIYSIFIQWAGRQKSTPESRGNNVEYFLLIVGDLWAQLSADESESDSHHSENERVLHKKEEVSQKADPQPQE